MKFLDIIRSKSLLVKIVIFVSATFLSGFILNSILNMNVNNPYEKSKNFQFVWIVTIILTAFYYHVLLKKNTPQLPKHAKEHNNFINLIFKKGIIPRHISKLDEGVDFLIFDYNHLNQSQIKQLDDFINKNVDYKHHSKIIRINNY